VEDTAPLILTLPAEHTAELWVVDLNDKFVDADIASGVLDFEALSLSTGRYEIRAPGSEVGVRVTYEGLGYSATVPLDESVHLVRVGDAADLLVHARCDADCPSLHSQMGQCDEESPGEFVCPCNPEARDSIVADQPEHRYVRVAPGQTDATLDLRSGHATVRGIWGGVVPVTIMASGNGGGSAASLAEFEFPVMPGPHDITFVDRVNQTAHVAIDLEPGELLDLGVVPPDTLRPLPGSIVADFPVVGSLNEVGGSFAHADITAESKGDFSLQVSSAQESVDLWFSTEEYGSFRGNFPTNAPIEWDISWHMDRHGLSDEDIADVMMANEDTGFDPDTGLY
jgi:hypothetical protein